MRKIFAFLMAICMIATVLCVSAFAADDAEPAAGGVIRVSAMKRNGDIQVIKDYASFAEGWEAAIDLGENKTEMKNNDFLRVVVDLYADWKANGEGEFGDSDDDGFRQSTIHIPTGVAITINMNGHKIDRDLKEWEYDGEVIFIDDRTDVIINGGNAKNPIIKKGEDAGDVKFGTITGGWSCNGAGGIHIGDKSSVVLKNVNVVGNVVEDDKGAGIAVYEGSSLVMNGGSISDNRLDVYFDTLERTEGGLYVDEATVVLNDVIISGNYSNNGEAMGVAISLNSSSKVTLNRCYVFENADKDKQYLHSLFYLDDSDSELVINDSHITNNGRPVYSRERMSWSTAFASNGKLTLNNCVITGNKTYALVPGGEYSSADNNFNSCVITDNVSSVVGRLTSDFSGAKHTFTKCRFNNNFPVKSEENILFTDSFEGTRLATVRLIDCEMGDSTIKESKYITTQNTSNTAQGSIFSEGSLTTVVSIIALVTSAVSICFTVFYNKKRTAPATANNEAEDEK